MLRAYNNVEMPLSPTRPYNQADAWTERELLDALQSNIHAIIITSTVRAARALRQRYNLLQRAGGSAVWTSPQILAWEPWLETLWDAAVLSGAETRVLLTDTQELELWHKVLAHDDDAKNTLSVAALAERAQQAWKQMHQYRIFTASLRRDSSLDVAAFSRWAAELDTICRRSSFLSPALIEAEIARLISVNEISVPQNIFLVGFDRVTPAQMFLIQALAARGCSAQFVELSTSESGVSNCVITCARTAEQEIAATAHWIRHTLLANPGQRIGVIVPELEKMRSSIDATFRRILAPSSMDVRARQTSLPYEFSLGTPMYQLQPVRTALTLLRWLDEAISVEEVSWLTVHGDFSAERDGSQDARARLDRKFRGREFQLGGPISLPAFRHWLSNAGKSDDVKDFRRSLERLSALANREEMGKSRSFAEWREIVDEALSAAEWRLLNATESTDYQLLRRWSVLLDELSSLNSVAGPVRFSTVIEKLEHFAVHMLFTLETRNAPVQILGTSESAGIVFDAVWWLNAQASVWPPHGNTQPFLPWSLQREAHMPYADPAEDYTFALRATNRILNSGKNVVVSFALQERDAANIGMHIPDREILLSPIVREALPNTPILAVEEFLPELSQPIESSIAVPGSLEQPVLEQIAEEPFVPFNATEIRSGVRFLELHAACPFRAFAELRLGSQPLAEIQLGLSPNAQGSIAHRVLEQFWLEMKSQKTLLETTTEEHRRSLRQHIDNALTKFFEHANEPWQQTLLEVEAEKLEARLLQWLEQEKQRPDFTVIETEAALEHEQIGGIEIRCRIDRVDQVQQGVVLLDYKTGPVDRNSCEGDRPDQPQLPAYAVLRGRAAGQEQAEIAGVAFAGLHPRKLGFTVVGSLPSVFSKSSTTTGGSTDESGSSSGPRRISRWNPASLSPAEMRELQALWTASLTQLAEDFRAGAALVDPKKHAETCKYCGQMLLCRIRETAGVIGGADVEADQESSLAIGNSES